MSYKVEVRPDARAYPVIVCDKCSELIIKATEGNTLWREAVPGVSLPRRYDPVHTHKKCNFAFERKHPCGPGEHWMSNDIDHHLFMLMLNTRHNAKEGKRQAELLACLG